MPFLGSSVAKGSGNQGKSGGSKPLGAPILGAMGLLASRHRYYCPTEHGPPRQAYPRVWPHTAKWREADSSGCRQLSEIGSPSLRLSMEASTVHRSMFHESTSA